MQTDDYFYLIYAKQPLVINRIHVKGHRRASSLTSAPNQPKSNQQNIPSSLSNSIIGSNSISNNSSRQNQQRDRPKTINLDNQISPNQANLQIKIPHNQDTFNITSPITEDEFFDAIDEVIENYDLIDENSEYNEKQLEKIKAISRSKSSSSITETNDITINQKQQINRSSSKSSFQSAQSQFYSQESRIREDSIPENTDMESNLENIPPTSSLNMDKNVGDINGNKASPAKPTHQYTDKIIAHRTEHAKSLFETSTDQNWIEFHREGNMILCRRDQTTPEGRVIDPIRLVHKIEKVSAYECLHYFWETEYRLDWEHTIESFKIIEVVDDHTIVLHQHHTRVWPASKRDAVYLSTIEKYDDNELDEKTLNDPNYIDTWIVTNFSIEHPKAPSAALTKSNTVRVFINISMICQTFKYDSTKPISRDNVYTKVIYISQVDPGGWVPPAALRKVYAKEYPRFLKKFSKYVNGKTSKQVEVRMQK